MSDGSRRPDDTASTSLAPVGPAEQILKKLHQVRFADYFTILELDPAAPLPAGAVGSHYEDLRRRFDPRAYEDRVAPEVGAHLTEILAGLEDARVVLSDRTLRERYRQAIRQPDNTPR